MTQEPVIQCRAEPAKVDDWVCFGVRREEEEEVVKLEFNTLFEGICLLMLC